MKGDILEMVEEFLRNCEFVSSLNFTFFVLIPEDVGAMDVRASRPSI